MDTVKIFVSYSHKNDEWVDEGGKYDLIPWLKKQLEVYNVVFWIDHALEEHVGEEFQKRIKENIDSSDIALLMVSQDFASSKFITEFELPWIKEAFAAEKIKIVPLLLERLSNMGKRRMEWLFELQTIPNDTKPLIDYSDSDINWKNIRIDILNALEGKIEAIRKDRKNKPSGNGGNEKPPVNIGVQPPDNNKSYNDYWIEKTSKESMDLVKRFKEIFSEYLGEYDLHYTNTQIGLRKNNTTNNFVFFTPQKREVVIWIKIDKTEDIDRVLDESGLSQLAYDRQIKTYKIRFSEKDLTENIDILKFLVKTAYENNKYHQATKDVTSKNTSTSEETGTPNNPRMTIKEAVLKSLEDLKEPTGSVSITDHILEKKYYSLTGNYYNTVAGICSILLKNDSSVKCKKEKGSNLYYLAEYEPSGDD